MFSPQECTHDILAALQINSDIVTKDVLSLKDKARKLVCDWLHHFCRTSLSDTVLAHAVPCHEEQLREAFIIGGALMRTDCRDPRWHLLYVDILLAKGEAGAEPNVTAVEIMIQAGAGEQDSSFTVMLPSCCR